MNGHFGILITVGALAGLGLSGSYFGTGTSTTPPPDLTTVVNQILPPAPVGAPPGMTTGSTADISADVASGVTNIDQSLRKVPGYAGQWATNFTQYGIAAFAYEDPALTAAGNAIGQQFGQGVRSMATALSKDMAVSVQQSGR